MGLIIKRNSEGLYNLKSSISDEQLHDEEWITEDKAKEVLINKAFVDFVEKVIEIDMEFPSKYTVNGKRSMDRTKPFASQFFLNAYSGDYNKIITEKYNEIIDKLKLDLPKLD